jgi:hypothetical protein
MGAPILVHGGTVYWIGATESASLVEGGLPHGGAGTTILSATAGTVPTTLLSMAMSPGPLDASAPDAGGTNPPINAIALSPDYQTIYFSAGARFYSIPSAGAATADDVKYVGRSRNADDFTTVLAADEARLYYPAQFSGNIEVLSLATICDADAGAIGSCPRSFKATCALNDTILLVSHFVYWSNCERVERGDIDSVRDAAPIGFYYNRETVSQTQFSSVTGFGIGTENAYFGDEGFENPGYIEKSALPPFEAGVTPSAQLLARGQPRPSSFALDGRNVYFTTSNCDINYIADSPQ